MAKVTKVSVPLETPIAAPPPPMARLEEESILVEKGPEGRVLYSKLKKTPEASNFEVVIYKYNHGYLEISLFDPFFYISVFPLFDEFLG